MKPYVFSIAPSEDLEIFIKIEKIFQMLPETDLKVNRCNRKALVSCHMVARALAKFFPLVVKDGHFGGLVEHSWLVTKNGLIIDSYPVGMAGGPILIETRCLATSFWTDLYQEGALDVVNEPWFQSCVDIVTEEIRQVFAKMEIPTT